uniref:LTA synthase family protein n=1 Tax=uncultured Polaribacter sp. TaxID=174711 RepID=UPI00260BC6F0|nr:alkaline phosphatase family protein [uncultured Polaribacter sp.]
MKIIFNKLSVLLKYFLFWIVFFVFARLFFLLFYLDKSIEIGLKNVFLSFVYGIQLDLSFTSYLCLLPFLLISFSFFIEKNIIKKILNFYSFTVIIFCCLIMVIDVGLYKAWGVRIDSTFLNYINTPELMLASVSKTQLIIGTLAWFLISFIFIKFYNKLFKNFNKKVDKGHFIEIVVFLFFTASLIIPVRGGFQTIPVNQSNVYFSNKMFANHAAINYTWNFFNTIKRKTDNTNPYKIYSQEEANQIVSKTRNTLLKNQQETILNTQKPNVILIIWESLSAKIVGSLNGEPTVTPNLNRLSKEGILFTNFYSNGDRTDKGIPAILSGYYPQPAIRIMRMPNKTRSLPMLPKEMEKLGYETSFYYGGDLNFGNLNTYLRSAGIQKIIDGSEFDKKDWNSKWGAYDDVFLKRFASDLTKDNKQPFFKIALTLSSHEPYEIKGEYKFGKNGESNKYRSAHFYTDKVIGEFIDFAKKQDWYKNTLIVIMSDHGHSSPTPDNPYFGTKKFHIPMLWLGGALSKKGIEIDNISSQVDFSYTLLNLLKADTSKFNFGKHIFNNSEEQYAYYSFNKGFGMYSRKGTFIYDYVSKKPIQKIGVTKELDSLGKAITQLSYQDFLERK